MKTHKWRDVAEKTFGPERAEELRQQARDELEAEAWMKQSGQVQSLLSAYAELGYNFWADLQAVVVAAYLAGKKAGR